MQALWLCSWLPGKLDILNGDFIERHAEAVSQKMKLVVLFAERDTSLENGKIETEVTEKNNLIIYRTYYGSSKLGTKNMQALASLSRYKKIMTSLYKDAVTKHGHFDLAHVHVPLKAGAFALWLKRKYQLKFVLTEQDASYLPPDHAFLQIPAWRRSIIKRIFKKADAIHVCTKYMGKELSHLKLVNHFTVIPNVVNTNVFYYKEKTNNDTIQFITVTGNITHKNTDGVIRSFAAYLQKGYQSLLHIVGPNDAALKQIAFSLNVSDHIIFHGSVSNDEVARINQLCDAHIFFTRYESFGCVMAEALCCGLPVIASRLPVLEENLTENSNALFVKSENEDDLTAMLIRFNNNRSSFNNKEIAATAQLKYNYNAIADSFLRLYQSL